MQLKGHASLPQVGGGGILPHIAQRLLAYTRRWGILPIQLGGYKSLLFVGVGGG